MAESDKTHSDPGKDQHPSGGDGSLLEGILGALSSAGDPGFGFAGERKAFALLVLAFYMALYGLIALLMSTAPPEETEMRQWMLFFGALGATYAVAFYALAASWFWARWFAIGLGWSGLTMTFWSIVTMKTLNPVLLFYGATHGVVALFLQGKRLIAEYEGRPEWRKRFGLTDDGVQRVRNSVTRAAVSLPTLIMICLAPRPEEEGLLRLGAVLGVVGLLGLLRMRTWGVVSLLSAGTVLALSSSQLHLHAVGVPFGSRLDLSSLTVLTAGLLYFAAAPFLRPMLRFVSADARR